MRSRTAAALTIAMVSASGCLPAERINASCEWKEERSTLAPPGAPSRKAHLAADVRVAQDLGIRHGDSVGGRRWHQPSVDARAACTEASLSAIMRHHGASRAELDAVVGVRDPLPDLVLVLIPVALLFVVACRSACEHFVRDYDRDDRVMAIVTLAMVMPAVAAAGVVFGQIWGVVVEELRLRSNHVSYRAYYTPLHAYKWHALVMASVAYCVTATVVLRRNERAPSYRGRRGTIHPYARGRGLTREDRPQAERPSG